MDEAKIRLSKEEMELVCSANWILTKNGILEKTKELFGLLLTRYQQILQPYAKELPAEIFIASPKISKGENYRGLPYLVLDYPRHFTAQDVFAIRTLFWWGNFFSITLHLSGLYKKKYEKKILGSFSSLAKNNFYCCAGDDPWQHHFNKDNYFPLAERDMPDVEKMISEKPFIKLAAKLDLQQWENSPLILEKHFRQIMEMLAG